MLSVLVKAIQSTVLEHPRSNKRQQKTVTVKKLAVEVEKPAVPAGKPEVTVEKTFDRCFEAAVKYL